MLFRHGEVFIDGKFERKDILVEDGFVKEISDTITGDGNEVDCTGLRIVPGFFDIHTHGCLSYDFSLSNPEEIKEMCEYYVKHGVTSILATTMTNEENQYHRAMGYIKEVMDDQKEHPDTKEAVIEGINMEGPFFGIEKKGAHDPQYLRRISQDLFDEYNELSGNAIRLVDIDPTLDGAVEFIQRNKEFFTISLAHTMSTFDQAEVAAKAGATNVTHLFNAMRPLLHREPGLVGAVSEFGLNAEIICDGIHVHPAVVKLMFKAVPEQMILISDSINPTGLPDGEYVAGGLPITVKDHKAFLKDGTLAGSTITLFDAVKNAVSFGIPVEEAILSASYYPAKSLKLEDTVGSIGVGRKADLLLVDGDFNLKQVYVRGNEI
jgi:N-acetylglucosamine-6-phosphate deacetylase